MQYVIRQFIFLATDVYILQDINPALRWSRFDMYARLVRSVSLNVSPVVSVLATQRPGIILFPNLLHLVLQSMPFLSNSFPFPSSLRHLELSFGFPGMVNEPGCCGEVWLSTAVRQAPALERLDLAGSPHRTSILCIAEHKNLRVVDLYNVDINARHGGPIFRDLLTALSSMKQLATLHLPHTGVASADIPSCKGFQRLEHLTISARPSVLVMFFDCLLTRNLHEVTLSQSSSIYEPFDLPELEYSVARLCSLHGSSLREVDLRFAAPDGLGREKTNDMDVLHPLLELHHLESVTIMSASGRLFVSNVQAMAQVWPHLRNLKLSLDIVADDKPGTLKVSAYQCLVPLAHLCEKLTDLDIRIVDTHMAELESWPTMHHRLVNLALDVPHTLDPEPLISLVYHIFPALSQLSVRGASDDYEYDEREWANLYQRYQVLRI